MLTIDTHLHTSDNRFEPIEVALFQMDRHGVDKAVLTPSRFVHDPLRGTYDNDYMLECVRRYPGRFSMLCAVDITQPDALDTLAGWAAKGAEGVRFYAHERSTGSDPLAIWSQASDLGMVVSCAGTTEATGSDDFRRLVEALPDLPIIIEHLGVMGELTKIREWANPEPPYTDFKKVLALSAFPNVYMKIPGLGEFMPMPIPFRVPLFDFDEMPPFIDMAIEAFGAHRLMLGSDFPPVSSREGYRYVWQYLREYLARRSTSEQEAIFGGTAASLFQFQPK